MFKQMLNKPIFGHQEQIKLFEKALTNNKLHHAWLFSGIKGIGKATIAHMFAQMLLNIGNTSHSRLVDNNTHPDLFILEDEPTDGIKSASSEIKIDQVRKLISFIRLTPVLATRKVVVIDSVNSLNINGINALLKVLEEPVGPTIFLIVCHSLSSIPATIKSRCSLLKFQPLSKFDFGQIVKFLDTTVADIDAVYEASGGSLNIINSSNTHNADLAKAIDELVRDRPKVAIQDLMFIKKQFSNEDSWDHVTSLIISAQIKKIKQASLNSSHDEVNNLIEWLQETIRLLRDKSIFHLDGENVALTILSQ